MNHLIACPNCSSEYTYENRGMYNCSECAHEWIPSEEKTEDGEIKIRDSNGNLLSEGDSVTLIKDLKVKGSSNVLKIGTKVKILRLVDGDHDIDCRIDGIGSMMLKSSFVKKTSGK